MRSVFTVYRSIEIGEERTSLRFPIHPKFQNGEWESLMQVSLYAKLLAFGLFNYNKNECNSCLHSFKGFNNFTVKLSKGLKNCYAKLENNYSLTFSVVGTPQGTFTF